VHLEGTAPPDLIRQMANRNGLDVPDGLFETPERFRSRTGLPAFSESTAVLFQALPYVLTLIVVAGVIGRSRPPAAIGVPYVKE
jgi:hypothetical protein